MNDLIICRILQDLEPFVGTDSRIYSLKKEDVVTLPKENAEVLIGRGLAEIIITDVHGDAMKILEHGDPIAHMLKVYNKDHVGDVLLGKSYIATIGCTLCSNTHGIHPGTTGKSGAGKSHSMMTLLHQIPEKYIFKGSFSDQAWFYAEMKPGTVIFLDDAENLKDVHKDVIKQATTTYQEGFDRKISDPKNKNVIKVSIPPRCSFWVNSADGEYELQFLNRQINLSVDEGHLEDIFRKQTEDGITGDRLFTKDYDWKITVEMWDVLKGRETVKVKIPFLNDMEWNNKENPRNWPMFQDTICAFAAIRQFQREKDSDGAIIAKPEDADSAMEIWNKISREQRTKLNEKQLQVMQKIVELMRGKGKNEIPRVDLAKALPGLTKGDLTHILKGRKRSDGQYIGGLLNLAPGLDVQKITEKPDPYADAKHGELIIYNGTFDIWTEFTTLVRWRERPAS